MYEQQQLCIRFQQEQDQMIVISHCKGTISVCIVVAVDLAITGQLSTDGQHIGSDGFVHRLGGANRDDGAYFESAEQLAEMNEIEVPCAGDYSDSRLDSLGATVWKLQSTTWVALRCESKCKLRSNSFWFCFLQV